MNLNSFLILLFLLPVIVYGQTPKNDFPRDTSFSVRSAGENIKKEFPNAMAVKEFQGLKIKSEKDVVYRAFKNRELHADLFYPDKTLDKKIPAIILIHGGGWASGNKSHLVPMAQMLAAHSFFTATVEHRLSPEAKYPAAITDLKTFVKWVKTNAEKYYTDTTKIAVLGCSSGATLATLLGTIGQNPKFNSHKLEENISDKVHAIINIDGIVDFTDPAESGKDDDPNKPSAGARWFGYTFKQNPEVWVEASPLTYVNNETPPTLFINSSIPRFHAGRDEFTGILQQNGIYFEIHTIENTPHPFWLFHPWFDETWPLITQFLTRVFEK
ncbi:MAG: alpha/beta hydrolase [Mariniphaga sp.]|nr:alpha/beta hydrolase [Mariniphaga sp.]